MLPQKDIEAIFLKLKDKLLAYCISDDNPTAFLLGGQGASGKSRLSQKIQEMYDMPFLLINGDDYRVYHPEHEYLISKNIENYSSLTQSFSAIFTENLIREAVKNKFNVIIEGTMRNANIPFKTAGLLKENGFNVKVAVIAAHPKLTELNCYTRFFDEVILNKYGRFADIDSHNVAAENMPKSIDLLYNEKSVDSIYIFKSFPVEQIKVYNCYHGIWDDCTIPSLIIETERARQIKDKDLVTERLNLWKQKKDLLPEMKHFIIKGDNIFSEYQQ